MWSLIVPVLICRYVLCRAFPERFDRWPWED